MSNSIPSPRRGRPCDSPRAEFWRRVLGDFAASGQGVRAFCLARGVSQSSLYWWRRNLAGPDGRSSAGACTSDGPAFVPVRVAEEAHASIEIVLGGERRIRLCGPVDRATLAEVVAAVESVR